MTEVCDDLGFVFLHFGEIVFDFQPINVAERYPVLLFALACYIRTGG